jgi:plastocyanin
MRLKVMVHGLLCTAVLISSTHGQDHPSERPQADLSLRIVSSLPGRHGAVPAVAWLTAMQGTVVPLFVPKDHYVLMQKNRTFIPHLLVIPIGSVVQFPNTDPFYHNVFSLFEGKRFDLGLYEAGSSKSVTFSREGVSYIFCNIHPEMSAVVLTLSTPLFAVADANDAIVLHDISPGDYKLHLWIEGVPQSFLDGLGRPVRVAGRDLDLGTVSAPIARPGNMTHSNKFGNPYDSPTQSPY